MQMQVMVIAERLPAEETQQPRLGVQVNYAWVAPDGAGQPVTDLAQVLKVLRLAVDIVEGQVPFKPPLVVVGQKLPEGVM